MRKRKLSSWTILFMFLGIPCQYYSYNWDTEYPVIEHTVIEISEPIKKSSTTRGYYVSPCWIPISEEGNRKVWTSYLLSDSKWPLIDDCTLAWHLYEFFSPKCFSRFICSKYKNTLRFPAWVAMLQDTFGTTTYSYSKNTCATTILFPIQFEWLLKWQWLKDFWCQIYYCAHNISGTPQQQCRPESHFRLRQWLWVQQRLETVAAPGNIIQQWSPQFWI